jgi:hypothetical protein
MIANPEMVNGLRMSHHHKGRWAALGVGDDFAPCSAICKPRRRFEIRTG